MNGVHHWKKTYLMIEFFGYERRFAVLLAPSFGSSWSSQNRVVPFQVCMSKKPPDWSGASLSFAPEFADSCVH